MTKRKLTILRHIIFRWVRSAVMAGNYNNKLSQATTNQYYHNQKEISNEAGKTSEEQKNRMRAHNHDFKEVLMR